MKKIIMCVVVFMGLLYGAPAFSANILMLSDLIKAIDAIVKGDYSTAKEDLTPFAESGFPEAQASLGYIYLYGKGVPQDYKAAAKWYTLAAEQGDLKAQYLLAKIYDSPSIGLQDFNAAAKWYTLAAEQGLENAQSSLGVVYAEGILEDHIRSYMWLAVAAENGDNSASEVLNLISKMMSHTQIKTAKMLARECTAKNYKNCWRQTSSATSTSFEKNDK